MRKPMGVFVSGLLALAMLAGYESHATASQGEWSGWIVDAKCGASNANAKGKACVLSCYRGGAKLLLYTGADQPLLALDDQKLASEHVGGRVRVSGEREGDQVKVKSIRPDQAPDAAGPISGVRPGHH